MIEIEGPQLSLIQRILGKARLGSAAGTTHIADSEVLQTLPIVPSIVRRSAEFSGQSSGWYTGVLRNVHSAADDEESFIDPYRVGGSGFGGWPARLPDEYDVWIHQVSLQRTSGAGEVTGAQLRLGSVGASRFLGWGQSDAPAALNSQAAPVLVAFGAVNTNTGSGIDCATVLGTGEIAAILNYRIRRDTLIVFDSTVGAAATLDLVMTIGLFPAGMGQDVIG